ncbi:uncharacterized protein OCT59_001379 [Rhizophagus irregularis]|uniref:uncharacterized protein n=1 Tax=Rhizophagus irregularis TaxID=588596 RepID=UPI00332738F1|nr:hypothetical protein OCT59_001379 [Rhizophagus irregularis]
MTKGRKIENSGDESIVKPYMTSENIEAQNESVIESNIKEVKEMDANVMLIDDNKMDSMDNSMIYCKMGSARRELDDKLYIYLNFINTLLELKNVKMLVKDDKAEIQKEIQDGKVPAIKKALVSCKETIGEAIK